MRACSFVPLTEAGAPHLADAARRANVDDRLMDAQSNEPTAQERNIFSGLKVVDLASHIVGPAATSIQRAALGAVGVESA
jgi:crotonobetainyl-CoA:carnitine CoA-transferase CaiB-like acyl-CoA transferase